MLIRFVYFVFILSMVCVHGMERVLVRFTVVGPCHYVTMSLCDDVIMDRGSTNECL